METRSKNPALACYINSLPEEILLKIFKYLTQNELARISRVCRRWYECTKRPVLWIKVNVKFSWLCGSQNEVALMFSKSLSSSVTCLRLEFANFGEAGLNFQQLCVKLKRRCPCLHTLILHHASISFSLSSVLNICSKILPHVKALILHACNFYDICKKGDNIDDSKIEILDVSHCVNVERYSFYTISRMPNLKKVGLSISYVTDSWFRHFDISSFLCHLEWFHLGFTNISSVTFRLTKMHAANLTKLFLCQTVLFDYDLEFSNSTFPLLKTVCLKSARSVTVRGIVSILQSCPSLQNVYVEEDLAVSCVQHPFFIANESKLGILQDVDCKDHRKVEFLLY